MDFAGFASAFSGWVWSTPLAVLLTAAGLLFSLMTLGIQFKAITHGFNVIRGKYDNPEDEGNISHFKALCTALSATIGLGNISGVAVAVSIGGAGAVFWMWVVGFLGMATKFTTCTLGMMYRKQDSSGTYRGGPMYYIEIGLGKKWKWLAVMFALLGTCACIGAGNMFQSNQVSAIVSDAAVEYYSNQGVGLEDADQTRIRYGVGGVMCFLAGLVLIGGIKRIGNTASKIVPTMCVLYVSAAVFIIVTNLGQVPALLSSIFTDAFTGTAASGAFLGVAVKTALLTGVKRACFSNEAGLGSAPMAHATAKTNEPVREGVVAAVGPFIDTIVICTMTALVVLITQAHTRPAIGTVVSVSEERIDAESPDDVEIEIGVRIEDETVARVGKRLKVVSVENSLENTPKVENLPVARVVDGTAYLVVAFSNTDDARKDFDEKQRGALQVGSNAFLHKEGVSLTAYAFDQVIPGFGIWFLPIAAFLFAFSTVISWGFYGETCVEYMLGERAILPFKVVYVGMVMVGALFAGVKPVLDFSDAMLGLMLIPNMIGTLLLAPRVMRASKDYFLRLGRGDFEEEARIAAEAKARLKAGGS